MQTAADALTEQAHQATFGVCQTSRQSSPLMDSKLQRFGRTQTINFKKEFQESQVQFLSQRHGLWADTKTLMHV